MSEAAPPTVVRAAGLRLDPDSLLDGRYRVLEHIADGAVASVLRGRDEQTGQAVALKLFDPLRAGDAVGRARLRREFEVLTRLDHRGIARCLRLTQVDDVDLLVLEFLDGETLHSRLQRGRLPVREATAITRDIAQALAACHRAGVLHRDLKPANVMLHPERGAVVLDFGVAWFTGAATLTRTGAVIGTPQYMAPELFSSSLVDGRSDLYTLGTMLFEMLAGQPLRSEDSVAALVAAGVEAPLPSLQALRPGLPPVLQQLVEACCSAHPEQRPASAGEVLDALQAERWRDGPVLERHLRCERCRTPLVIDLPLCPGCGAEHDWNLAPGRFAVQLDRVQEPARSAHLLATRFGAALRSSRASVRTRLAHAPVPLIAGVSQFTAEQTASELRRLGDQPQVVRARRILGAPLSASAATPAEMAVAAALHLAAVTVGGAALLLAGASVGSVAALPAGVALLGLVVARSYARRPLLRPRFDAAARQAPPPALAELRPRLAALASERGRHLAATAVARAAPVLLPTAAALPSALQEDVLDLLRQALERVAVVDAQSQLLQARSRSHLLKQIAEGEAQAERGDADAVARLVGHRQELEELVEASLAHDLAAREALELCSRISGLLRTAAP